MKECRGAVSDNGMRHPTCRAFMDDVTIMSPKETGTRWTLKRLDELATWGRLTFKAAKSRSLILIKGKVKNRTFNNYARRTDADHYREPHKVLIEMV